MILTYTLLSLESIYKIVYLKNRKDKIHYLAKGFKYFKGK